jgi:hypothetical protein
LLEGILVSLKVRYHLCACCQSCRRFEKWDTGLGAWMRLAILNQRESQTSIVEAWSFSAAGFWEWSDGFETFVFGPLKLVVVLQVNTQPSFLVLLSLETSSVIHSKLSSHFKNPRPASHLRTFAFRLFKLPFFDSTHDLPDYRTIFNSFQIQE